MMADVTSWLTGRNPELKDVKVLLDNSKSKGTLKKYTRKVLTQISNAYLRR